MHAPARKSLRHSAGARSVPRVTVSGCACERACVLRENLHSSAGRQRRQFAPEGTSRTPRKSTPRKFFSPDVTGVAAARAISDTKLPRRRRRVLDRRAPRRVALRHCARENYSCNGGARSIRSPVVRYFLCRFALRAACVSRGHFAVRKVPARRPRGYPELSISRQVRPRAALIRPTRNFIPA